MIVEFIASEAAALRFPSHSYRAIQQSPAPLVFDPDESDAPVDIGITTTTKLAVRAVVHEIYKDRNTAETPIDIYLIPHRYSRSRKQEMVGRLVVTGHTPFSRTQVARDVDAMLAKG